MIRRTAASLVAVIGVTPCHAFARPRTATALARPSRLAASRFCHRPLAMAAGAAEGQEDLGFDQTRLYPQPALQNEGMLAVSDLHTVAWFEYGNPNGKPVLFVHGGPGGGTAPMNARYFNAEAYRIILVDQRGCGNRLPLRSSRRTRRGTLWKTSRSCGSTWAWTPGKCLVEAGAPPSPFRTRSRIPSA
jgi:hypothetical protein